MHQISFRPESPPMVTSPLFRSESDTYSAAVATAIFSAKGSWCDVTIGRSFCVNDSCETEADLGTGEMPDDPVSVAFIENSEVEFDDLHEKKTEDEASTSLWSTFICRNQPLTFVRQVWWCIARFTGTLRHWIKKAISQVHFVSPLCASEQAYVHQDQRHSLATQN